MKLAYLANVKFPNQRAHSVQIAHMCNAFMAAGVEVDLYVNKRQVLKKNEIDIFFNFDTKFKIIHLPPKLFFPRIQWTFYLAEFLFSMMFLLKSKEASYDVIYTRNEWIAYFISLWSSPKKIVWESHEAKYNFPARQILKKGVNCVCISEGISEFYQKVGVSKEQMVVAHDAVDDSFFAPQPTTKEVRLRLEVPEDKKVVMYIGGFDSWKGVGTFLKASNLLEDILFVAIGGTKDEVKKLSSMYPRVEFLGPLPYKDLPANQQAADILVVPNTAENLLSEKYTSPLKLFAHMTSGIPLIESDIPSLVSVTGRDLVTLFEPDKPSSLAAAINSVLANYATKSAAAKQLKESSQGYTWNNRAKKILDFVAHE